MCKTSIINAPCNSATDLTIISPAGRVVVRGWVHLRSIIIRPSRVIIIISYDNIIKYYYYYCVAVLGLFNAGARGIRMCNNSINIMVVVNWGVARPTTVTNAHDRDEQAKFEQSQFVIFCSVCTLCALCARKKLTALSAMIYVVRVR